MVPPKCVHVRKDAALVLDATQTVISAHNRRWHHDERQQDIPTLTVAFGKDVDTAIIDRSFELDSAVPDRECASVTRLFQTNYLTDLHVLLGQPPPERQL